MKTYIDGHVYKIKQINPLSVELDRGEHPSKIHYEAGTIYIANDLSWIEIRAALVRELTRAFIHRGGYQKETYTETDLCHVFELYGHRVEAESEWILKQLKRRQLRNM